VVPVGFPAFARHSATKNEARLKNKIYQQVSAELGEIGILSATGQIQRARKRTYGFLGSHSAKLWGLSKAGLWNLPMSELNGIAETLDLARPFDEPVPCHQVPKSDGLRHRTICDLPPGLKAAHYMLGRVIAAQTKLIDHVFPRPGFGHHDLTEAVLPLLNDGYGFVSVLDIKDCFDSVNPRILDTLPVHERFVQHTLRTENLNFATASRNHGEETREATTIDKSSGTIRQSANTGVPKGLMQGSPASWSIMAWAWKDLPVIDEELGYVFVHVDDVLIVAKSAAGRGEIKDAVVRYWQDCPAGPLELEARDIDPGEPFDFLGYQFTPYEGDGCFEPRLSERAFLKLEQQLPKLVEIDRLRGSDFPYLAARKLADILGGYRLAVDAEWYQDIYLETLLDYNLGATGPFESRS
jgi:hypothetical protein